LNVWLSDVLSTYQKETRLAIPLHEILGHAIATWDEQYCKAQTYPVGHVCYNQQQFASTPNWHDFMNTGPESRHGIEDIECERLNRTLYDGACYQTVVIDPCIKGPQNGSFIWEPCRLTGTWTNMDNGDGWEPSTGIWYDKLNRIQFYPCNEFNQHWSPLKGLKGTWTIPNENLGYDVELNQFVIVPSC
jgi:hypothetical protein